MRELKRIRGENALRLEIAQQEQQLRALACAGFGPSVSHVSLDPHGRRVERASVLEGFADPDSLFVNAADYIGEVGYGYGPGQQSPWLSTRSDRQDGRNRPMFATETELAAIRGAARLLANYNPNAVGILEHLTNYTIGEGFDYKCVDLSGGRDELARRCQRVVDRFIDDNDFVGDVDAELFFRSRSDGEYFYGLWHQGHGRIEARIIEPEQVTEPAKSDDISEWLEYEGADNWSFGVHVKADDTESIHGYYVQWTNNPQDWDYLPGGKCPCYSPPSGSACWVEHAKVNVSRKITRGLSDFFCAQVMLEAARKLLRNMGTGASIQAAIAWIVETAAGTLPATVTSLAASQSAGAYGQQTQQGSRSLQTARYDPGTVLYTPNGTQYKSAPMGSANAPNFVLVYESMMRSLAVRWQMPEHMVTGSAANNDYASILEAGSPFEKAVRRKQQFYARSHNRILWKVLQFACEAGALGDIDFPTLKQAVHLVIRPPRVAVRDRLKEVQADQILVGMGAMSPATAAANDGLDYKEEVADGAGEEAATLSVPARK
ncbi:MAG TPA: phage portal protein [Pirellulales bacterium]|nr:phage portal protein [Pirellulales bacterium]